MQQRTHVDPEYLWISVIAPLAPKRRLPYLACNFLACTTFASINLVMPVAVDRTPDMGASSDKGTVGDPQPQEIPQADKPKKIRYRTLQKAKEAAGEQFVAGSSTEQAHDDGSSWAWRSLTESSASKVKPVFTKDGRCVCTGSSSECSF